MSDSNISNVVIASTSLGAGIASLPKTGDSILLTILSFAAIAFGIIIIFSAIATKIIKKVL